MDRINNFGDTHDVAITVLVDNRADLLEESSDTVKRFNKKPLLAEHGFSALIDLQASGIKILWDAGISRGVLLENMRRMDIDPNSVDKIAISHGHKDHTAAVTDFLKAMDLKPEAREWGADIPDEELRVWAHGRRIPVIAHPAAYRERWNISKDGKKHGPYRIPSQDEWTAVGAEIILSERPFNLGPGCWTTGSIPRLSFENSGTPDNRIYREDNKFLKDNIEDDQAIVINIAGKGLVILSGCAHSGIVNTVNYACEISGVNQIWAVIGGFHMANSSESDTLNTIEQLKGRHPKLIAPSHCTGFPAIAQFAAQMPGGFVSAVVGTTYLF